MGTKSGIRLYRIKSVGLDGANGGGFLVVIVGSSRFKKLSEVCGRFSWNGFFVQLFAPMLVTEDVTDKIKNYAFITKKVGIVFEMIHDVFDAFSCSLPGSLECSFRKQLIVMVSYNDYTKPYSNRLCGIARCCGRIRGAF